MLHDTCPDVSYTYTYPFQVVFRPLIPSTDGVELGLIFMGLVVLLTMVTTYKRINARREAIMKEASESGGLQYTNEELRGMGDKAPNFRYGI